MVEIGEKLSLTNFKCLTKLPNLSPHQFSHYMAGTSNLCQQHLTCFIDGTDSHFIPFGTMTTHNNEHTKNNNVKATGLCQETYFGGALHAGIF